MKIYAVKILEIENDKLEYLTSKISSEKRETINKFYNRKDKIRSLIGEILVRVKLAEDFGIGNEDIVFEKNDYGKLYIKGYSNLHFNISHSGDWVICGIDEKDIGVDVEKIKNIEYEEIARNFFSEKESNYILNKDKKNQLARFYEMWTLKESYVKCCGKGLSIPLKSFSILRGGEDIKLIQDNMNLKCSFKIFEIDEHYKCAVCSINEKNSLDIDIIKVNQEKLLDKYYKISL